jgi:hypothetical protein
MSYRPLKQFNILVQFNIFKKAFAKNKYSRCPSLLRMQSVNAYSQRTSDLISNIVYFENHQVQRVFFAGFIIKAIKICNYVSQKHSWHVKQIFWYIYFSTPKIQLLLSTRLIV